MSATAEIGVRVRLTTEEAYLVVLVGAVKTCMARLDGLHDRYGKVDVDPWGCHIQGIAGELAVAKLTGRYYVPVFHRQTADERDVDTFEVRCTEHEHGHLLIKDGDYPNVYYVLVVGTLPELRVVGWILGREGRRPEWRRNVRGREAFFVPQAALTPWPQREQA